MHCTLLALTLHTTPHYQPINPIDATMPLLCRSTIGSSLPNSVNIASILAADDVEVGEGAGQQDELGAPDEDEEEALEAADEEGVVDVGYTAAGSSMQPVV